MPLHLSTDGVVTKCGRPVGELVLDGCTGDPDLFDCLECEDNLGRPYAAAVAAESYGRGYDQGKDKAYFELRVHRQGEHLAGCGCRPCLAVQSLAEKLLYQWAYAAALEQAAQDEEIARAAVAAVSLDAARPGPSIHRAGLHALGIRPGRAW